MELWHCASVLELQTLDHLAAFGGDEIDNIGSGAFGQLCMLPVEDVFQVSRILGHDFMDVTLVLRIFKDAGSCCQN